MQLWVLWQYYYYPDIDCQMSESPLGGSNGVRQLWQLKSKMWQICSFICKSKEAFRIAVLLTQRWNKPEEDYSSRSGKWWNYSVTQALISLSAFSARIKKMKIRAEGILWDKLCYISIYRSTNGHVLEFSVTLSQRIKCKRQQLSNRFKNLKTL